MKNKKTFICNPKYANQILELQKVSSAGGKSATIAYPPACKHSVNNETRDLFIIHLLIINVRSSPFNDCFISRREHGLQTILSQRYGNKLSFG